MNSQQIASILAHKCRGFYGVFAVNNLPSVLPARRPLIYVCNTDPIGKPGQHWIVICLNSNSTGDYFDSFGRKPLMAFENFLNRNCVSWTFNPKQLQSAASRFCGHYCVFYCLYRSIKFKPTTIVNWFSNDTGLNDVLVHAFVCKLLK